jgi:hypothetical protein
MTDRATLTALYLDQVARSGVRTSELLGSLPDSELLDSLYHQRYLPRPVFLGHAEREQLDQDLENLGAALLSLPDRRYDGDIAAFARALCMTDVQVRATLRSRCQPATRLTRADLYADQSGFRVLEFNIGSPVGGIDNAELCRALLEHALLAEFAGTHRLSYVDTMREQVDTILGETGAEPGSFPVVAVADWPAHYPGFRPYLCRLSVRWRELGLDAHPCHVGELEVRGGRVWLGGRPVDIIFRLFLIEHLLEPDGPALIDPVLDAAARGEVAMFTPMDSELFGSKGALAMLSDERNRHLFTAAELASLDRVLPWTRMVRPGPVTLEDGRTVDLHDYALGHQDDLVLKPALMGGGRGVVLGSDRLCGPEQWRGQFGQAIDEPYVIQRRVRPEPEMFPADRGELVPWIVTWGVFTVAAGHGGIYTRAVTEASEVTTINRHSGAHVGSGLCAAAPRRPSAEAGRSPSGPAARQDQARVSPPP